MRFRTLGVALSTLFVGASLAHDFWIRPASFRPKPGEVLNLHLMVGDRFEGEPVVRNDEKIRKFVVVGPDGVEKNVVGRPGDDPAGRYRPTSEGLYVAGYRSKNSAIELSGEKFEAYLREEGLDGISALRKSRGETDKAAKETYSRCAKTLFRVGEGGTQVCDRTLGFDLEIVPTSNPYAAVAGDSFGVRLRFKDRPLSGAAMAALHLTRKDDGSRPELRTVDARTDAEGRATFVLDRAGVWMIKCVHMIETEPASGFDFESFWASLTFDLAPAAAESRKASSRPVGAG
jgi:uncharacterized GH25 family protein